MNAVTNITLTILIAKQLKSFGPLLGQNKNITAILWEVQHMPTFQQMMTPSSIFPFNTAMANLAAQYVHENAAMSQFLATNKTMQSNLNIIMQELQSSTKCTTAMNIHQQY